MTQASAPSSGPAPAANGPASAPASSSPRVCPGCGGAVDPLRAGHVAILEGHFHYFCHAGCKQQYLRARGRPLEEDVATARPPDVARFVEALAPPSSRARPRFPSSPGQAGDGPAPSAVAEAPPSPRASRPTLPSPPSAPPPPRPTSPSSPEPSLAPPARAPAPSHPPARASAPSHPSAPSLAHPPARASAPSHPSAPSLAHPPARASAPSHPSAPPLTHPATRASAPSLSGALAPDGPPRRESLHPALDALGIILGAVVPALALLGDVAEIARLPLVLASFGILAARCLLVTRDPADPHPLVVLGPTGGAALAAVWAAAGKDPHAASIAVLAGLGSAVGIAVELLAARARARVVQLRAHVRASLDAPARVMRVGQTLVVAAAEIRPGETILVEAGETVPVDGTVSAGEARVVPWPDASLDVVKREGDPVVAGARVVSSRLRITTVWAGTERAWVKLLGRQRVDVAAPTPHTLRLVVERGAPVAGVLLGLAALGAGATPVQIFASACAGALAFGAKSAVSFVALHFARAHLEALAGGITYKDPRAFERAAATNVAVLSARGTVLLGEPEIVAIEPIGSFDLERVLALAAGAETASTHPFAAAVLRAARTRGVEADPVRNATAHAGLGVTASASTGERLVVGGRAMMLEQKVGVAIADARISELEAQGRSVLLVALGDRLVGLVALMDGLRPGARAAVQKLLDARVEPVLLSGEARETVETIARALDVEHVRPEVLPADRGPEVRALTEGGSVVAVVGHPSSDDGALGAADVPIAMGAAGSAPGEWAVALASDDIRDAASAIAIPHLARERARAAIVMAAAPAMVALLAVGFGIASPALAPLGALVGAVALAVQAREPV
jgi:Cu+-exporting ATPase